METIKKIRKIYSEKSFDKISGYNLITVNVKYNNKNKLLI